ncbi:MAG: phosphate ABC transporter permease PstA [Syntrophomonadaceae bacterium]|jgi:phosphate transport system permease protein|nr:phosphate ABC transporter permease PstA [Syntrophomonadaceae bacterium]
MILKRNSSERIMALMTWAAAILTIGTLLFLIAFILVKGIPHIKLSLFSLTYNSENVSFMPALISTFIIVFISLAIAVPLGISSAIYLTEYARSGNKIVALIHMTTETLSGIPSIVYGLFGGLFFVAALGWGYSVLAGAFTLVIMILPLIMRSSEEAIKAVPDMYSEGSFGLGAGKLRTIFKIILPSAMPGILAGIILSAGRIVGETAALIYTSGTVAQIPATPMDSARTLAVHMYAISNEGLHSNESYATAVILLVVTILINAVSVRIAKKFGDSNNELF